MLDVYRSLRGLFAVPLVTGRKSASERFPGAVNVLDRGVDAGRKALQAGTSHDLGQNFARAYEIVPIAKQHVSIRPPGAFRRGCSAGSSWPRRRPGLRLPPASHRSRPWSCRSGARRRRRPFCRGARGARRAGNGRLRVRLDDRDGLTPGLKFNDWEMRGVPVRIEIGPRDVAARNAVLARRDRSGKEGKAVASLDGLAAHVRALLDEVQESLYTQARDAMRANTREFDDYAKFRAQMEGEGGGGMADIYWCGSAACETRIREETRATCARLRLDRAAPPADAWSAANPRTSAPFSPRRTDDFFYFFGLSRERYCPWSGRSRQARR